MALDLAKLFFHFLKSKSFVNDMTSLKKLRGQIIIVNSTTAGAYNPAHRDTGMRFQVFLVVFPVPDTITGHL